MDISARGYVSKPEAKTTKSGKAFSQFTLGVKQKEKAYKDKPEKVTWANFTVVDWNNASPPPEKSYVTLKGYLKVRDYETKDGRKGQALEITAQELTVAEPFQSAATPTKTEQSDDRKAESDDPFGDLPF